MGAGEGPPSGPPLYGWSEEASKLLHAALSSSLTRDLCQEEQSRLVGLFFSRGKPCSIAKNATHLLGPPTAGIVADPIPIFPPSPISSTLKNLTRGNGDWPINGS